MSKPKRYDVGMTEETCPTMGTSRWPWVYPSEQGRYVLHSDCAALAAENERLTRLLLDLSDAVHFHRANADTAKCSATIDRIVAEVDKMHPIS